MQTVFQKLNLTTQKKIVICNAPESFAGALVGAALQALAIRQGEKGQVSCGRPPVSPIRRTEEACC